MKGKKEVGGKRVNERKKREMREREKINKKIPKLILY